MIPYRELNFAISFLAMTLNLNPAYFWDFPNLLMIAYSSKIKLCDSDYSGRDT